MQRHQEGETLSIKPRPTSAEIRDRINKIKEREGAKDPAVPRKGSEDQEPQKKS